MNDDIMHIYCMPWTPGKHDKTFTVSHDMAMHRCTSLFLFLFKLLKK
jgi:hypothetical protein